MSQSIRVAAMAFPKVVLAAVQRRICRKECPRKSGSARAIIDAVSHVRQSVSAARSRPQATIAPRVDAVVVPSSINHEGAGKAGCPPHPWSACNKKHAAEPQVQA